MVRDDDVAMPKLRWRWSERMRSHIYNRFRIRISLRNLCHPSLLQSMNSQVKVTCILQSLSRLITI